MRALLAAGLGLALLGGACVPRPVQGPGSAPASPTPKVTQARAAATARVAIGRAAASARRGSRARVPDATATPAPSTLDNSRAAADSSAAPAPGSLLGAAPVVSAPRLDGLLDGILPEPNSDYAVVLEDLTSGTRTAINDTEVFPSASLYKLGVAWLVMRQVDAGSLNLDAPLTIEPEDTIEDEPDGGVAAGDTPSVGDALAAMLEVSSNAAAHAFLRVLGRSTLNQEMDRIGMSQTRVPDDSLAVTSAADVAHLLRLLATSPELSASSRNVLMQCLANIAPPDALRDTLPESVDIVDKTGNLEDASNVGALLGSARSTVILVVLDRGVDPGDARAIIARTGAVIFRTLLQ